MQSSSCHEITSIISVFILLSLLFSPIFCLEDFLEENETSMTETMSKKMKLINASLRKINKPFLKSIKSSDGDIIDCVLFHLQPAFDHPEIRGKMSMFPPELPKGHGTTGGNSEIKQLWNSNGESCPNGTVPIKRTSARDILRSTSISTFGKKYSRKDIVATVSHGHEHAIGYVTGGEFYGAKAVLNVWQPNVTGFDFSLSQIWFIYDVPGLPANTVEAGWQVNPVVHGDNLPRLFTYWTPDGYQSGCYNLLCSGFVHTSANVCLGAAIDPISTYNGQQYDVTFQIWKDATNGYWWLMVGTEVVGYWPANLFKYLVDHATTIEYGGEVYSGTMSKHTSTEMGSGHFQDEGFQKAAYVRNMEVIDENNMASAVSDLNLLAEKSNCYGVTKGYGDVWGNYIFFGGPGNNPNCP